MKKFTLFLSLCLMTMCNVFAEDIVVWEGNLAGDINFFSDGNETEKANYDKLINVAKLAEGDIITIFYTGADDDKLWLQDKPDWRAYDIAITGCTNDVLTDGDGTYVINVREALVEAIKTTGLRLRRGNKPVFSFTKVVVTKGGKEEGGGGEGGDPTSNIIKIWEGESSEDHLFWAPQSAEFNKIFGDGKNQANAQAGDIFRFYYKNATVDVDQVWVQANWDGVGINGATPTLHEAEGSCEFILTQAAIDKYKAAGVRFQRPNGTTYILTKVEIEKVKQDESLKRPGADETILWEGNETGDYTLSFRYGPNKSNFVTAVQAGAYVNVYLSNVAAGDKIYAKECANWNYLNDGATELTEGQQIYSLQFTQDMLDKVSAGGLVFQQHDTEVYKYTFRYVTVSTDNKAATAIKEVVAGAENGVAYNLAGQRVGANAKGLVIINGKKVIK